jgi:hypothetical protein
MLVVLDLAVPRPGSETAAAAALTLLVKVAAGAALYATALATMWLASGRPEGPERQALRVVLRWSKRLVRQDARS